MLLTYFPASQCHREERAGGCEPAAGFWHRCPPRRPRHLPPHHLPRQVLNEDYNETTRLFRNATATIQVFSVSLSLKARVTVEKMDDWLSS